jgi:hypothetical protein
MARLHKIAGTHAVTGANHRVTTAKRSGSNVLDLAGVRKTQQPLPMKHATPAKHVGTHATAAVTAFLSHMSEEIGDAPLAFSVWRTSYDDLRLEYGWPELPDKVLSLAMQQCGCVASTIDDRKKGRGRYRAYSYRGAP